MSVALWLCLDFTNIGQLLQISCRLRLLKTIYIISAQTKQSAALFKSPVIPNSDSIHLCSAGSSREWESGHRVRSTSQSKDWYSNIAQFLNMWHHRFGVNVNHKQIKKQTWCLNAAPWQFYCESSMFRTAAHHWSDSNSKWHFNCNTMLAANGLTPHTNTECY